MICEVADVMCEGEDAMCVKEDVSSVRRGFNVRSGHRHIRNLGLKHRPAGSEARGAVLTQSYSNTHRLFHNQSHRSKDTTAEEDKELQKHFRAKLQSASIGAIVTN